jgi:aspartyl protease family protein
MTSLLRIVFLSAVLLCAPAMATNVVVLGLFTDKALLQIDGTQRLVTTEKPSPEGIKLIRANSREAVLEIEGRQETFTLGQHVSSFSAPSQAEVKIWSDNNGMFFTKGSVNGLPVNFLVDTGASDVAMSVAQARRLGINYRYKGTEGAADTAAGLTRTYSLKLKSVKVGDIVLRDVNALILEENTADYVLLGMSFLNRMEINNTGQVMTIRQKY